MNIKKLSAIFMCLIIAVCAAPTIGYSADGIDADYGVVEVQAASKISLSKTTAYVVKGKTTKLKVNGTSKTVKWYTSNKNIATVSSKGVVTGKAKGKATITAKVSGKKLKCTVNVETPKISAKSASITIFKTKTLKVSGTKQKVTWKSSNKNIATVNKNGKITAKKLGTATITATVGSQKKYTCKVTVKDTQKGANFTKLKNYINKYGKTGQNGDKYLSVNYSFTDNIGYKGNYHTEIQFFNGELWFSTIVEHENDSDAMISVHVHRYDDQSYTCFDYAGGYYDTFFKTSKYNKQELDYYPEDSDKIDYTMSDWANSCLWVCLSECEYMLDDCGLTLRDLGFTNYKG